MHLMMFGKELWLRPCKTSPPEIITGVNLLSKHDFNMLPEIKNQSRGTPRAPQSLHFKNGSSLFRVGKAAAFE